MPNANDWEFVDQLFGVILELVLRSKPFDIPATLVERLRSTLQTRVAKKGETLHVEELLAVRDFNKWLQPIGVKLHNAWVTREKILAPHAFSYKLRRDLTAREKKGMKPTDVDGNDNDVFVVYKTWMHSTDIKGPLLVLPANRLAWMHSLSPQELVPNERLTNKRRNELLDLAHIIRRPQYDLQRAADALVVHASGQRQALPTCTAWLERLEADRGIPLAETGSELFGHLPDTSWDLLANFHRQT